ncbi:START-like domain-containing protein [Aquirufa sp.]|jgi:uncharacterized protein YndB with AHSA1/START domain|uniref:START-like domain-containing protein n=1 Tax=Aquirufa sp. TaxID=2676249 RepID=UPI0037C0DCB8
MPAVSYEFEIEIKASPKVLYPYISTASGLQQWFADKVTVQSQQGFIFLWDNENHPATIVHNKLNKSFKLDFTKAGEPAHSACIEFKLDVSELSNTTYLVITDSASTFKSASDAQELWDYLTDKLKEIVGS